MAALSKHGIILFAHGARNAEWAEPFEKIRDQFSASHSEAPIVLAFLELMHPDLHEAIETLAQKSVTQITLIPLFLAQGGHLKRDLPKLVSEANKKYPDIVIKTTEAIGENDFILNAISTWVNRTYEKNLND